MVAKLQTIIFNKKDKWSMKDALLWIKSHDYKDDVDITDTQYRFRQRRPRENMKYFIYKIYHKETEKSAPKAIQMVYYE